MRLSKYLYTLIISTILFASCEKKTENTMTVSGTIDGLKKGTLFFQKIKDTTLVNLDSLEIKGNGEFLFTYEVETPEVFYLYLDKADNNTVNDRIKFFGEKGNITINTSWNTFDAKPEILGSNSNEEYQEFQSMISKFNTRELELAQYIIKQPNEIDIKVVDSVNELIKSNSLRKYRYIVNFGLTNPESYVTPYVTLVEASDANPKYLDSILRTLNPEVAKSKYGEELKKYLEKLN